MYAFEHFQPLLYIRRIHLERFGQYLGIELIALDAGHGQELPVFFAQAVDLALDQAAQRLRHLPLDFGDGPVQNPSPVLLNHGATVAQIAHEIHQEQGIAASLGVDRGKKLL